MQIHVHDFCAQRHRHSEGLEGEREGDGVGPPRNACANLHRVCQKYENAKRWLPFGAVWGRLGPSGASREIESRFKAV